MHVDLMRGFSSSQDMILWDWIEAYTRIFPANSTAAIIAYPCLLPSRWQPRGLPMSLETPVLILLVWRSLVVHWHRVS